MPADASGASPGQTAPSTESASEVRAAAFEASDPLDPESDSSGGADSAGADSAGDSAASAGDGSAGADSAGDSADAESAASAGDGSAGADSAGESAAAESAAWAGDGSAGADSAGADSAGDSAAGKSAASAGDGSAGERSAREGSNRVSPLPTGEGTEILRTLRFDLVAGLTVALVGLPQCLAYAMMSGLPPAYGLATAAVPGLLAAIAGRSSHVVTGPTNTTGLLILAALGPWLGANGLLEPAGLPALATLVFLAGLVRIVAALAGASELLRFLPESVLVGFTAGAGILIGVMQLDEALGIRDVRGGDLIEQFTALGQSILRGGAFAWPAVAVTIASGALIALGSQRLRRWPIALLVVLAAMGASWAFGLDASSGLPLVRDRSSVPSGWPPFALPDLSPSMLSTFLVPAIAISVLGTLELTVAARGGGARPDMRRELLAQGIANLGGAFSGAFPASASLTRSALLRLGGARTRMGAASAALIVVPILLLAGESVGFIPQASLAGVLLVTAYGMIDRARMKRMWRTSPETRTLMVLTLGATLMLPLEWAILLGTGAGLAIHLARTSEPRVRFLVPKDERLLAMPEGASPRVVVVEVSGNLHYAAVPSFVARVRASLPRSAEIVVIDLSHAHELRFAAMIALEELGRELEARGTHLHLAGVSERFRAALTNAGSDLRVTSEEIEPGASTRRALAEAERRPRPDRAR